MNILESFNVDNAVKWAQIIGPLLYGVALIVAILNARPYRKRIGVAVSHSYNIHEGIRSSMDLMMILSNMCLRPIIIKSFKIKFKNKQGSYYKRPDLTETKFKDLEIGKSIRIDLPIFIDRDFKDETCKAKIKIRLKDVDGKIYRHNNILYQDFRQFYKPEK